VEHAGSATASYATLNNYLSNTDSSCVRMSVVVCGRGSCAGPCADEAAQIIHRCRAIEAGAVRVLNKLMDAIRRGGGCGVGKPAKRKGMRQRTPRDVAVCIIGDDRGSALEREESLVNPDRVGKRENVLGLWRVVTGSKGMCIGRDTTAVMHRGHFGREAR